MKGDGASWSVSTFEKSAMVLVTGDTHSGGIIGINPGWTDWLHRQAGQDLPQYRNSRSSLLLAFTLLANAMLQASRMPVTADQGAFRLSMQNA